MDGDDVIARYRAGASMRALAENYNTSTHAIRKTLIAADEPLKPRGRQRLAVSSDTIADLYEAGLEFDEIAARLGVHPQFARGRYNEVRAQRGLVRRGRWHRFLLDALDQQLRVVVVPAVAEHLGRHPTVNESDAVRRAAHDLARAGDATLDYESLTWRGRSSSYLVISRSRDRGTTPNQPGDPAQAVRASRVGHIPWYEVFDDALATRAVVAVSRLAEAHLGRTPTRTEFRSAHRAANGYSRSSDAQTLNIWTRRGDRKIQTLFLARGDADLDDTDQLLAATIDGPAHAPRTPSGSSSTQNVKALVASIVEDAAASDRVDIKGLDPTQAQQLTDEIAEALNGFRRFRDRLHQHSRQVDPEASHLSV